MEKTARIFVAGHNGMVGSAIVRLLKQRGYSNVLTVSRQDVDLRDGLKVADYFARTKPEYVILAAARVGGIKANSTFPADFLLENLMVQNNIIPQAHKVGARKLFYLGSSCIYPRECPQPIKEEYLLTGPLEPTNEGYAIAKIAGLRLAQYFQKQYGLKCLNLMPCNLYGTNDHFDLEKSHVLSALVRKFVDAKDEGKPEVEIWGTGVARREFLHVDDLAEALLYLDEHYDSSDIINVGTGSDVTIRELAELVKKTVEYKGALVWNKKMPDGMLLKCMDVTKLFGLGFRPRISLEEGVRKTVEEYRALKAAGEVTR